MTQLTPEQKKEVLQLIQSEFDKNFDSGSPQSPPQRHDGNDGLKIRQSDLVEFLRFPGKNERGGVQWQATYRTPPQKVTGSGNLPLPMIEGSGVGTTSQFDGGNAEIGTMLVFYNEDIATQIWIKVKDVLDGGWAGVTLNLSA